MASTSPVETKKRLALAIIDFLNSSLSDGTVAQDDRESIEVATSCISDAFKVDLANIDTTSEALSSGQNLLSIYSVYEKLRDKSASSKDGTSGGSEDKPGAPAASAKDPEAETLKGKGNVAMQAKDYTSAIELYSKAIELSPTNPIYLSNRAAAYSATTQHELAKSDAEMAVASDPKYTKAWSRLGLARYALGDAKGSMEAYKNGIDAEGNGGSDAMKRGYETAKRKVQEHGGEADIGSPRGTGTTGTPAGGMPDLSGLASMLGGGGGGGMPDLGALMQNPMMRQMAQNIMSNPSAMQNMMSNPRIQEMMNQFGGGANSGNGPDLASLMQDPSIAEMARNFMGGAGDASGRGASP